MLLEWMPKDWHESVSSYEWWRDIGTGLLGVFAAVSVGLVTVWVAAKSNRIAANTQEFQNQVRAEDERRAIRERLRDERLDRSDIAGKIYEYASKRREESLGRQLSVSEMPPGLLRGVILDQAEYLGVAETVRTIVEDIDGVLNPQSVSGASLEATLATASLMSAYIDNSVRGWVRSGEYQRVGGRNL